MRRKLQTGIAQAFRVLGSWEFGAFFQGFEGFFQEFEDPEAPGASRVRVAGCAG